MAETLPPVGVPATVSTDSLPAPQISAPDGSPEDKGVVWSQVIVGNTVYAGGFFTSSRPAGAARGTGEAARSNLLSYNITTGVLDPDFAPVFNGTVRVVASSPDGSRLYVGGDFSSVNGVGRYRSAAFDTATGVLVESFAPIANTRVTSIAATNTTVYLGGWFTTMSGLARPYAAAVSAKTGAVLPFAPRFAGGTVAALVISPDQSKVIVGGSFTTANGSSNPGYGMAAVNAVTGASLPWKANNDVRNGGSSAGITSLSADGDSVYGTGYVFHGAGNLEGAFRASWADGSVIWIEDCHGDSYSAVPIAGVVYVASHAHYCGNIGGFPQTSPLMTQRGTAFTKEPKTTITAEPYGYFNWAGRPAPAYLDFWPDFATGKASGAGQAGWSVTGNTNYVIFGGEFPTVNGTPQQGLARFATSSLAPNRDGPRLTGANYVPTLIPQLPGSVQVNWLANYDRDNATLRYDLIRDGKTGTPIYSTTAVSHNWFVRPIMAFKDSRLVPGSAHTYQVRAIDPSGNVATGAPARVIVTSAASGYSSRVLADSASNYWRLGEPSGPTAYDTVATNNLTTTSGVTRGRAGAINGDSDAASTFNGINGFATTSTAVPGPNTFSIETWFATMSTRGGKVVGFGNAKLGSSTSYDRSVYLDSAGHVLFGVNSAGVRTAQSPKQYNDGLWHHVVATLSPAGLKLYVDGGLVGANATATSGQSYSGYWRIGGDSTWAGDPYFAGFIDEVAIYPVALGPTTVAAHFTLSGR